MSERTAEEIREAIRKNYKGIAQSRSAGASCCSSFCCGGDSDGAPGELAVTLGYSMEELSQAPQASNMGLGCGNPLAIASLRPGETVLDIGSGGGFDAFLAAAAVGETGRVIGVDATPEMVHRARQLAAEHGYDNVDFRLGEMENLPVADCAVDVIISNCVINLSPEKPRVLEELFRVLRAGGRLAISDVVATGELPAEIKEDLTLYSSCIAGACTIDELEAMLTKAGFVGIVIRPKEESKTFIREWAPGINAEEFVVSAMIEAVKPG
ncbi:MAG: arsenite methyltransferase [Anaerolineae bacterium]|jgi:SAM-dependent methyltransferase